jgi:hypothetical protein
MEICLPYRRCSAGCKGRSVYPAALRLWRPDDILIIALLDVTSYNGRAVHLVVSIVTTLPSTTTNIVLQVDPLLAGRRLHG